MTSTVFLLLTLFGIKHFVADFVMQYSYMVRDKGTYGAPGGIHHAATHACWTFIILIPFVHNADHLLILPLVDGIVHYHIDYFKQKLNHGLTALDNMFWVWLGLDQALHYLTYIGIIYYVTIS